MNPIAIAIAMNASFVARVFCGDKEQTQEIFKQVMQHNGYSFIDVLQPCPSFNKINTFKWYKENTYYVDEDYDPFDQITAFQTVINNNKCPLGVMYKNPNRPTYEENVKIYANNSIPTLSTGCEF